MRSLPNKGVRPLRVTEGETEESMRVAAVKKPSRNNLMRPGEESAHRVIRGSGAGKGSGVEKKGKRTARKASKSRKK